MRAPGRLRLAVVVAVLAAVGLATGCSTTLGDVPLPGVGVSGDKITVDVEFAEALNLARGATVKVNGVDSGKVQEVTAEDFHAKASMQVKTAAKLRMGATYRLRYTTPLGELFVDVTNPDSGPLVKDGATIPLSASSTAPTVEDALSQASLLVNGGGLGDLQTVTEELNTALGGREDTARELLERGRTFLVEANKTTADVDRALQSLSSVSVTLRQRQDIINRAVREITPAARVLRQNTPGLTRLLQEVRRFSGTANDMVQRTSSEILHVIRRADPILAEFQANHAAYPASLEQLISLGGDISNLVPGDYVNISLALHLDGIALPDLGGILGQLGQNLPGLHIPHLPLLGKQGTLAGLLEAGRR